jgi:hypothetical protein
MSLTFKETSRLQIHALSVPPDNMVGGDREVVPNRKLSTGLTTRKRGKVCLKETEIGMKQTNLFDGDRADRLKREGMEQAEDNAQSSLKLARMVARQIATRKGVVNADDVGRVLQRDYNLHTLGPAAGSLFRGKEWEFTGNWVKSKRVTNHSRMLREWRLKIPKPNLNTDSHYY